MDYVIGITLILVVVAVWLVPVVISLTKGHIIGGVIGLVIFSPAAWVTSALIAKPNSPWARRFYGPEKLARAHQRYPEKQSPPPESSTTPASDPPALGADGDWRCRICGEVSATKIAAESHVRGAHAPAPVESSIEVLPGS